jgi:DNA-binding NtrC family response regulator
MIETDSRAAASSPNLAFVIDDDARICQFVAATLAEHGFEVDDFQTAKTALACVEARRPALIFLEVALSQSDAIDVLRGLGERHYGGVVQLMSGGAPWLLDAIRRIGARAGIALGEPLKKPVTRDAIVRVITNARLPVPPAREAAEGSRASPAIRRE